MTLLEVEGLKKYYHAPRRWGRASGPPVRAVDGVSFSLARGETLALVGESGCGKTTTARAVTRLVEPTAGTVRFDGEDLLALSPEALRQQRRDLQIVLQDANGALDPRWTAGEIVAEPLRNFGVGSRAERRERVQWLLSKVGLQPQTADRWPHELSGGQRQRLGIARALALEPRLIVCDEPASSLDVSLQAQVLNLLMDLQAEFGLAYLFIAHDLRVVRHISHRVAVMYLGRIVELAACDTLFAAPRHPYTEILLSALLVPDPRARPKRLSQHGEPPSAAHPPGGCAFHTRCPLAQPLCSTVAPSLTARPAADDAGHWVACHFR